MRFRPKALMCTMAVVEETVGLSILSEMKSEDAGPVPFLMSVRCE